MGTILITETIYFVNLMSSSNKKDNFSQIQYFHTATATSIVENTSKHSSIKWSYMIAPLNIYLT